MELVDIYDERHKKLGYVKERRKLSEGEFKLSCFAFIINDNDELLVQQRLKDAKHYPNLWSPTSGACDTGEDNLACIKREIKEELGLDVFYKDIRYIGNYARTNDFVEVFLVKSNININEVKIQKEEVQAVKWMKIKDYIELMNNGQASDTGFYVFKYYYDNYYNKCVEFEDGMPISIDLI